VLNYVYALEMVLYGETGAQLPTSPVVIP
jgi:hypothetical protein